MTIKSKELIIKEGLIDFSNDKNTFFSVNVSKGIIDVYCEINNSKTNEKFEIILKNYEISDKGQEFEFNINKNIKVKVNMIIKNKFFDKSFNLASRMKIFNQTKNENNNEIVKKPIVINSNIKDRLKIFNQENNNNNKINVKYKQMDNEKINIKESYVFHDSNNFNNNEFKSCVFNFTGSLKINEYDKTNENKISQEEIKKSENLEGNKMEKKELKQKDNKEDNKIENKIKNEELKQEIVKEKLKQEENIIENTIMKQEENKIKNEELKQEENIIENKNKIEELKQDENIIENKISKEELKEEENIIENKKIKEEENILENGELKQVENIEDIKLKNKEKKLKENINENKIEKEEEEIKYEENISENNLFKNDLKHEENINENKINLYENEEIKEIKQKENINDNKLEKEKIKQEENTKDNQIQLEELKKEEKKELNEVINQNENIEQNQIENIKINKNDNIEQNKLENIDKNKLENIKINQNENIEQNQIENIKINQNENIEQNKLENIEINQIENIEQNKLENIEQNQIENIEINQNENIEQNQNENIEQNQIENIEQNKLENIEQNQIENIEIKQNEIIEQNKIKQDENIDNNKIKQEETKQTENIEKNEIEKETIKQDENINQNSIENNKIKQNETIFQNKLIKEEIKQEEKNTTENNKTQEEIKENENILKQNENTLNKDSKELKLNIPNSQIETSNNNTNQDTPLGNNITPSPFLPSIPYLNYIKTVSQNKKIETFSEGFFISSFPKENGKVIERSQSFISQCLHEECSKLPSMQSEIIFRYPLEDTKYLELNDLAATITFPTGIKVCYNEKKPFFYNENYMANITNQLGERYYMMTYHFYVKMSNIDYGKVYQMHPLKHHLMKFADPYLDNNEIDDKVMESIQENLEFCQDLGFRDFVYIPYCLSIISKYPYIKQMSKCLESILYVLENNNNDNLINDLIMYLIHSIPIPKKEYKINFYIPYILMPVEISCPHYKDMSLLNNNYLLLLQLFPIDNIITIFRLMLFEKKILFIDNAYDILSKVTDCFISLLYPLQWVNPFIPIMSNQMVKYLQAFLPFINGINRSLLPLVKESLFEIEDTIKDDEIFIVSIDKKIIELSSNLIGKKNDFNKYLNKNIPKLPKENENKLRYELYKIKEDYDNDEKKNRNSINFKNSLFIYDLQIKNAFLNFFAEILFDYTNYIAQIDDDVIFNINLLLKNRNKKDHFFYKELTETQIFSQFTQNVFKEDYTYFNQQINQKYQRIKTIPNIFKAENEYFIKPDFIKFEDIIIKDKNNQIIEEFEDVSKKIIEKDVIINNENYKIENCKFYIIKEKKIEKKLSFDFKPKYIKDNKKTKTNDDNLDEGEKEKLKDEIKNFFFKLYNLEKISSPENVKFQICNILKYPFGRHYFIELLSQNNKKIKVLNLNYTNLLCIFIYNALIGFLTESENDIILEDIIKTLKASKFYGLTEKKRNVTIFEKIIPKLYTYSKILQINFWKKWFEIELFEYKKNDIIEDDIKKIFHVIIKNMFIFKLEKDFIKNVGEEILKDYFGINTNNFFLLKDELLTLLYVQKYK